MTGLHVSAMNPARLDAVRTGLAAGAGAGAAVGLMLAFRRQHHQEIATVLTDLDATERRITELYAKAVEQLGNDKAPVRLGGLYALGEVASAVIGSVLPCLGFVVVMLALGLAVSPGIVLAIPGALLVGYAFGAAGLAVTTYLRDFSDFQLIQLVMLPMFLFATTFYPLSVYPGWARPVVEILPLYQSIQLLREPALGTFHWDIVVAALYLAAFGSLALALATRRLTRQLLP